MKLKPSFETDVYISAGGYFAISQQTFLGEEQTVVLSPDQLRAVIAHARIQLRTERTWWSQEEHD
ncbi:hypothetical protein A7D27_11725 [Pseudomonas sp. 1D4]|uniref:hypothetical protein n=1 Tax=Pseudomonadaceae TaxID=135621 RepID=UPI00084A8824|nr:MULTISPECIES: hypothetical protein [Pseudomonas]OEC42541.1 hypothetical protein A7D27_11725 [Pseudomonas sp. 1D4]